MHKLYIYNINNLLIIGGELIKKDSVQTVKMSCVYRELRCIESAKRLKINQFSDWQIVYNFFNRRHCDRVCAVNGKRHS